MNSDEYKLLKECIKDIKELCSDPDLEGWLSPTQIHCAFDNVYGYEIVKEAIHRIGKKFHLI